MDVTQLALTWVGWPNGEKLACKFDLDQNERKSSQVNASARKAWPNGVASRPKYQTCVYLRVRLARALLKTTPNNISFPSEMLFSSLVVLLTEALAFKTCRLTR